LLIAMTKQMTISYASPSPRRRDGGTPCRPATHQSVAENADAARPTDWNGRLVTNSRLGARWMNAPMTRATNASAGSNKNAAVRNRASSRTRPRTCARRSGGSAEGIPRSSEGAPSSGRRRVTWSIDAPALWLTPLRDVLEALPYLGYAPAG